MTCLTWPEKGQKRRYVEMKALSTICWCASKQASNDQTNREKVNHVFTLLNCHFKNEISEWRYLKNKCRPRLTNYPVHSLTMPLLERGIRLLYHKWPPLVQLFRTKKIYTLLLLWVCASVFTKKMRGLLKHETCFRLSNWNKTISVRVLR